MIRTASTIFLTSTTILRLSPSRRWGQLRRFVIATGQLPWLTIIASDAGSRARRAPGMMTLPTVLDLVAVGGRRVDNAAADDKPLKSPPKPSRSTARFRRKSLRRGAQLAHVTRVNNRSNRGTRMSYREFNDESGQKWGVWFVSPASAERRHENRRGVVTARVSQGDRRAVPDRRRHPSRSRSAVAPGYDAGWLCFESERGEKRRLIPVPKNWEQGDADHLRAYLDEAVDAARCRPL